MEWCRERGECERVYLQKKTAQVQVHFLLMINSAIGYLTLVRSIAGSLTRPALPLIFTGS